MQIQENKFKSKKNIYKSHAQLIDIFGELCVAIWLAGLLWKVLSWKLTSVQDTLQLTYNSTSQYLKYDIGTLRYQRRWSKYWLN